jgi:hypothetical protein
MVAKIIAKGQRAPLLTLTSLDNVHMITVRPMKRPMEEWTSCGKLGAGATKRPQADRIVGQREVGQSANPAYNPSLGA